ncbi:MAG: hypothetical protein KJO07_26035 [Deltaproteobacteria bacterium]|nr:hypothetical protein [Deltaproteobacteria bacterium]
MSGSSSTPRGFLADQAVVPGHWEAGTSVTFSTATGLPSDAQVDLPNTARLGLQGRLSIGESFELAGSLALPPKRDEVTDDPPLVGGSLMGRYAVHRRHALYLRAEADRLLRIGGPKDDGMWAQAAAGWDGRSFMDRRQRWLAFSWNLGASAGQAVGAGGSEQPWLVEGVAGLGLHVLASFGDQGVGLTLGSDFRFPFADGGRAYWATDAPEINAQTRVDLHSSLFVTLATGWSIVTTFAYRDRGDAGSPESILPVLGGGFDQTQFLVGFSYGGTRKSDRVMELARN